MAPISQSILASMPEEIEPEEEGARPFLDLDKLRSDANRVVQVRRTVAKIQQKKQGSTEDVAAELSVTDLSSRQLCLNPNPPKDTDGRREGSGRGWVRELQGRWPGVLG